MAQGLQVWDSTSKVILDTNLQTSSILGIVNVNVVGTVVINDSRFSWGTPFFFSDSMYTGSELKGVFSGSQLTLTASSNNGGLAAFKPLKVFYGVF